MSFPYNAENFPALNPKAKGTQGEVNYGLYPHEADGVAATAQTLLAPYDVPAGRPRRFTEAERSFVAELFAADLAPDEALEAT